ncbi:MAG: helix-turn-helix transcriptional regulator [Ideonella sp.]|nr:helix-turn-helix transcriptional regulator [Ideonella sp.]
MKDFAAAAMMRLVRRGLLRQGLGLDSSPSPTGALVPLKDKRQLLEQLMQRHGPPVLLRLGEAVEDASDEPTLSALLAARGPEDLIERWQRLERFVHSRHRVLTLSRNATGCCLKHLSVGQDEAPSAAEDLLVFGLLVGLLKRLGVTALQARCLGDADWRWQGGQWQATTLPTQTATWELAWHAPVAQGHPLLPVAGTGSPHAARAALAADCGASWTLRRLAVALGLTPRTLQRHLNAAGTSFSKLCAEARLAHAAHLLIDGQEPIAQVGYLSGFTDQAHFSRSFRRLTAMSPSVYRNQFNRVCPAGTSPSTLTP